MTTYLWRLFRWFDYVKVSQDNMPDNMKEYIASRVRAKKEQPLKVAVIGGRGNGKTTLTAALEQFLMDEERIVTREYLHSERPNIIYYDHPGIDLDDATSDAYYSSLETFDVFIIVTSMRVKEIDLVLLEGIVKRLNKTVLFVRCKIDEDVDKLKAFSVPKSDEDVLITRIGDNIRNAIKNSVTTNIPVFIVSSIFPEKWDFLKLKEELITGAMKMLKQSTAHDVKKDVKVCIVGRKDSLEAIMKAMCWVMGVACFLFVPQFYYLFLEQAVRKGVEYLRFSYWFNDMTDKIKTRRSSHNLLYSELSPVQLVMDTVKESVLNARFEWLHLIPFFGTLPCAINAYRTTRRIGTNLLFQFENDALSKWFQEVDNEVERDQLSIP